VIVGILDQEVKEALVGILNQEAKGAIVEILEEKVEVVAEIEGGVEVEIIEVEVRVMTDITIVAIEVPVGTDIVENDIHLVVVILGIVQKDVQDLVIENLVLSLFQHQVEL